MEPLSDALEVEKLKRAIASYEDFPKPGIVFRDIFSLTREPTNFKLLVDILVNRVKVHSPDVDVIVGLDARGFIFGAVLALNLGKPFVPVRKRGKLAGELEKVSYELEYGSDTFEIQKSSINQGDKVVVVDDLLATGGTMKAAADLVTSLGGSVSLCLVCVELKDLKGREKLNFDCVSILTF